MNPLMGQPRRVRRLACERFPQRAASEGAASLAAQRVNGAGFDGILSRRRCPKTAFAFDGAPQVPYVFYDEHGFPEDEIKDGWPPLEESMGVSNVHSFELARVLVALHRLLAKRYPGAFVTAHMAVIPADRRKASVVEPDILFARRAGRRFRKSYKLAIEPAPDFMLEVLSEGTRNKDLGPKQAAYLKMGVREYWMFDPSRRYIPEAIVGLVPTDDAELASVSVSYRAIEPTEGTPHRRSDVLGLDFRAEPPRVGQREDYPEGWRTLRIHDPVSGHDLEDADELAERAETELQRAEAARQRAEAERQRADAAEAEVERLRALLRGPRG